MKNKALILLCALSLSSVYSSEIDPFNQRSRKLRDSLPALNAKANSLLQEALSKLNKKSYGCSEKKLYRELRKKFRNQYTSEFGKWIVDTNTLDKIKTKTSDSIYRDFKWYQAVVPGLSAKISDPAGEIMNVGGVFVGTDKFEHFSGSGYRYFKKHYLKRNSLKDTMEIGYRAETGIMGATMTGVMSWADMVANFNGMRFWNTMLGKYRDALTHQEVSPYLVCNNQKWYQVRKINFGEYIDNAWDEGINCSWFRTESMLRKVKERIAEYNEENNTNLSCPIEPRFLERLGKKYFHLPIPIINFMGHRVMLD